MAVITDEFMREMLGKSKSYTVAFLKATPKRYEPDAALIIREHARRNFSLRADGRLAIVCPVIDESGWSGVAIFDAGVEEVIRIMEEDPGVQAGVFTYEVHPVRSFPGDALPG